MDWTGQKLAESLCIYLTLGFGLVAFVAGYARQDFGLMMKVREGPVFDRTIDWVFDGSSKLLFQGRSAASKLCLEFARGGV